ncbi:MAG: Na/Pi cotransporter family protein [Clostridia bacterium]|nr:Na/Pi cotransporter family protein [Clostridia bacterium]
MEILFMILQLLCGLSIFLYGMDVMGDALKKTAGTRLKSLLEKMTSNPIKGFLLGLAVTAVIQSSSATTVMVVGFVNSGTMTLLQSVGVILGANLGTVVTAWLTAPAAMGQQEIAGGWTDLLKTDAWMPILAVIGIILIMFVKRGKKKDIGAILIGFAVLMVGMELMSGAVSEIPNETLASILTIFENPIFGLLAGLILTLIVQSSSASVGILQTFAGAGGNMTFGVALPIIVGQNIGTCITALISSIGANKNGKRAAIIHLSFNVIAAVVVLALYYTANGIFSIIDPMMGVNAWWIAIIHTVYKIIAIALIFPFYKQLEKISRIIVRDNKEDEETVNLLDERLFETPSIAVGRASDVVCSMAEISHTALKKALLLFSGPYDAKIADEVRDLEEKADKLEDALGSYLVKLSSYDMDAKDAEQITKLLHLIGDLERISDHAVNIVESAEEIKEKKLSFSDEANNELAVLRAAVSEILDMTYNALISNDIKLAAEIEPLEEVIDDLRDRIKLNHVLRLQKSECTIEHGFVLSDLLTNFERVSDHCSNIAGCVVEISRYDALDVHKYVDQMKHGSEEFREKYGSYRAKYSITATSEAKGNQ